MRWWQAGQVICRPANCSSHCRCCPQKGQENLNSAIDLRVLYVGAFLAWSFDRLRPGTKPRPKPVGASSFECGKEIP